VCLPPKVVILGAAFPAPMPRAWRLGMEAYVTVIDKSLPRL